MPSTARRRLLAGVVGFVALSGCSGKRPPATDTTDRAQTTRRTQTTHRPQTDRPGWVGLEVENNDDVPREIRVTVASDGERWFDRSLSLRPQSEPEFNSVLPIPESGSRRLRVEANLDDGGSAATSFSVSTGGDPQRLFVTIDGDGTLRLTQGTEPAEPIPTTEDE